MKRFAALCLVLVLLLSACGGRGPEPANGGDGLAALQETDDGTDSAGTGDDASKQDSKSGSANENEGKKQKKSDGDETSGGTSSSGGKKSGPSGSAPDASEGNKAAPQNPGAAAAVPIPDGTHSYDTDGSTTVSGNTRRMPKTTTLTARSPRGEEQTQIRDLRDSDGNGTVVETRLLYRKEGVYITYVKITATFPGGFTDVRELQPSQPELIAPTGAKPGANASFVMKGSGTRADVDVKAKRFEDVNVGDTTVNALVVDTKIVFSGAIEGQQNSTTWFWGKHVLALRESVATDVSNGPIRVQSQYQAALTRLP
jgi:hypothetical protein